MEIGLALVTLVIACFFVAKSAELVVGSITILAKKFHVSDFSMGFFVLGLATTTPEIFVGINAALDGEPQLSMGNLIGATIVLLSLIIGLNAILNREIHFVKSFKPTDMLLTCFIIFMPVFFLLDGVLSRFDGLTLIAFYVVFYFVLNRRQTFAEHIQQTLTHHHNHVGKKLALTAVGIIGLFVSSKFIVESAETIALTLNMPLVMVGLVLVSVGTNLPELTILFTSTRKHHNQLSLGDFLGSACANTPVLGMVALIHPIVLESPPKVFFSLGVLVVTLLSFLAFFLTDRKINRLEGVALVALYSFFLISEFLIKNRL